MNFSGVFVKEKFVSEVTVENAKVSRQFGFRRAVFAHD